MLENKCGTCSLCCKLPPVHSLKKPRNKWCQFCAKGSCGIYDTRPEECHTFECLWLASQKSPYPMREDDRPDRAHVYLEAKEKDGCVVAMCDPDYWNERTMQRVTEWAGKIAAPMFVVVANRMYGPDGRVYMVMDDGRVVTTVDMEQKVELGSVKPEDIN